MADRRPTREALVVPVVFGIALVCYSAKYLPYFSTTREAIGDDWDIFLPYLLIGDNWFAANGPFAVPWATPALCGGIPFYANPQSIYYTPTQWLSFVVSPLVAVRITFILYAALGGLGMYLLLRRPFRNSLEASLVGGVLFLFNGLFSHRMIVGHFAFHAFMLTPLAAFLLLRPGSIFNGLLAGCLFALMFQSGMVVLAAPMALVILWLGLAHALQGGNLRGFLIAGCVSLTTALALCGAKLVSSAAFISNFPRSYLPLPGIESVPKLLAVVFQMLFWRSTPDISKAWSHVRVVMGLHEWEYSITPVVLGLIVWWLWTWWTRRGAPLPKDSLRRVLLAALVVLFLIPLAVNYYEPSWNAFLKQLPLVHGTSSMSRWFAFYIPVCCVLAAWGIDAIPASARIPVAAITAVLAVTFQATEGPGHIPAQSYHAPYIEKEWAHLHETGQPRPIDHVVISTHNGRHVPQVNADNALVAGGSQGACYEAMFGYSLQHFPFGLLHDGPSLDVSDGYLNVKNPACFLYPTENSCEVGEHFPATRQAEAERFLDWKPVPFNVPPLQRVADIVNVLALLAVPVLLFVFGRRHKAR